MGDQAMTYVTGFSRKGHDEAAARRTSSLAALAATLGLVVVGLYLVDTLRAQRDVEECALSGRVGCDVVTLVPQDLDR